MSDINAGLDHIEEPGKKKMVVVGRHTEQIITRTDEGTRLALLHVAKTSCFFFFYSGYILFLTKGMLIVA